MRHLIALGWVTTLSIVLGPPGLRAEEKKPEGKAPDAAADKAKDKDARGQTAEGEKKFRDFNEVTKGAEKIDGLFTLHRKDEHLYAEVKPDQMTSPCWRRSTSRAAWGWPGSR